MSSLPDSTYACVHVRTAVQALCVYTGLMLCAGAVVAAGEDGCPNVYCSISDQRAQLGAIVATNADDRVSIAKALWRLGRILYECDRYADAAMTAACALQCASNAQVAADYHIAYASQALLLEDLDTIEHHAREAAALAPDYRWEPYHFLAMVNAARGQREAAIQYWLDALHSFSVAPRPEQAQAFLDAVSPYLRLFAGDDVKRLHRLLGDVAAAMPLNTNTIGLVTRLLCERIKCAYVYPEWCVDRAHPTIGEARPPAEWQSAHEWIAVTTRPPCQSVRSYSVTSACEAAVVAGLTAERHGDASTAVRHYSAVLAMPENQRRGTFVNGYTAEWFVWYRLAAMEQHLATRTPQTRARAARALENAVRCMHREQQGMMRAPEHAAHLSLLRMEHLLRAGNIDASMDALAHALALAPNGQRMETARRVLEQMRETSALTNTAEAVSRVAALFDVPRLMPAFEAYRRLLAVKSRGARTPCAGQLMTALERALCDKPACGIAAWRNQTQAYMPLNEAVMRLLTMRREGALDQELNERLDRWLAGHALTIPAEPEYAQLVTYAVAMARENVARGDGPCAVVFYCDVSAWQTTRVEVAYLRTSWEAGVVRMRLADKGEYPAWFGADGNVWTARVAAPRGVSRIEWNVYPTYAHACATPAALPFSQSVQFHHTNELALYTGVRRDIAMTVVAECELHRTDTESPHMIGTLDDWGGGQRAVALFDDGTHGDRVAGDPIFSRAARLAPHVDTAAFVIVRAPLVLPQPLPVSAYHHVRAIPYDECAPTSYVRVVEWQQ